MLLLCCMVVMSVSSLHLDWCVWEMGPILQQERIQRKQCFVHLILTSFDYWLICVLPYRHNVICRRSLNTLGGKQPDVILSQCHKFKIVSAFKFSSLPPTRCLYLCVNRKTKACKAIIRKKRVRYDPGLSSPKSVHHLRNKSSMQMVCRQTLSGQSCPVLSPTLTDRRYFCRCDLHAN